MPLFTLLTADTSAFGRPDKSTLSQQTLLEILVDNFEDKEKFLHFDGAYKDIFSWYGVAYNITNEVSIIDWDANGGGYYEEEDFPDEILESGGSIDLQWLPDSVESFAITNMELCGMVDTAALPRKLRKLCMGGNSFSGPFNTTRLPSTLKQIYINDNGFSGSLSLTDLPACLAIFLANSNKFGGTLNFGNLPDGLQTLCLFSNEFFGEVDLSSIPKSLVMLKIERNNIALTSLRLRRGGVNELTLDQGHLKKGDIFDTDGVPLTYINWIQAGVIRVTGK